MPSACQMSAPARCPARRRSRSQPGAAVCGGGIGVKDQRAGGGRRDLSRLPVVMVSREAQPDVMSSGGLRNCTSAVPCTAEAGETTVSTAASPGPAASRTSGGSARHWAGGSSRPPGAASRRHRLQRGLGPGPPGCLHPARYRSALGLRPCDLRHAAVSL